MARKDLHTLIRIRKWDVDERQRAVAVLLRREEAILSARAALAEERRRETTLLSGVDPTERYTFVAYLDRCARRDDEMAAALTELRRLIDEAREELSESYRRLKTFEVTQEAREDVEALEENRQDQMDLDEIGLNLHRRKA